MRLSCLSRVVGAAAWCDVGTLERPHATYRSHRILGLIQDICKLSSEAAKGVLAIVSGVDMSLFMAADQGQLMTMTHRIERRTQLQVRRWNSFMWLLIRTQRLLSHSSRGAVSLLPSGVLVDHLCVTSLPLLSGRVIDFNYHGSRAGSFYEATSTGAQAPAQCCTS
jgi:hypothetical protein